MAFTLPDLPYSFESLEPHIDARTMEIHHSKHHQGYVNKLNTALEEHPDLAKKTVEELLADLDAVPENIRVAVRNNGGGHANHSLFWTVMGPDGGELAGNLAEAIKQNFGNFADFKTEFTASALDRFGSGWAWLVIDGKNLAVTSTLNQDSPISEGKTPILGLDVWEHAYYLKYQNLRADYVEAWWNVVNWDQVEQNFQTATA